jgi:hypothetical protein
MGVISTQGFQFRLLAGTPYQQLDLFADEDINLSNNVTGIFDIGILPSDFTRQITIPGTKVNNAFFEHVYDISVESPFLFATNIKVPCYFDFGGFYLSNGYIQLNKVNVLANKFIESYEITIYGLLSSFGRDINRAYLTDLTSLSQYNHTSSYDNIKASWSGSLFSGDIVYPFADYGSGWQYTTGDDFFGVDDAQGGLSVQDYKPAIRVKAVWDAIFDYAGYTYSSSFWEQSWLDDVYMICNNQLKYPVYSNVDLETFGVIKLGALTGSTDILISNNTWTTLPWRNELEDRGGFLNNGAYTVTKQSNLSGVINLNFNVSCSVNNLPGQINVRLINTGSSTPQGENTLVTLNQFLGQTAVSRTGGINQTFELISPLYFGSVPVGTYYFQIWMNEYFATTDPTVTLDPGASTKSYIQIKKVNQAADGRVIDIPSNMPYGTTGIKLVDWISGIQKKFNLVIYPDNTKPNNFIVETFNNWYNKGNVLDFNQYINLDESLEVIPANNLAVNQLNFGDTLDGDYISQQFAKGANREFGKQYYTDTTNFYSQGKFEVKTTFASDPLIQIAGTGLSGSVTGGGTAPPTQFSAGTFKVSYVNSASLVCGNFTQAAFYQLYTNDGTFAQGKIMYYDAYGVTPVTGYSYIVKNTGGGSNPIHNLNTSTGEVGAATGFTC